MPGQFSQNVDLETDSLLDIAFKEMTNLKDPLTVIMFRARELEDIDDCEEIGKEIIEQTERSLRILQRLFDELKVKAAEIETSGELLRRLGEPHLGSIMEN